MKRIGLLGLFVFAGVQAPSGNLPPVDYSLGQESQPQANVPHGAVTKHILAPGKYFPGTPHNYQLFVPAQYDPGRPLAFMIFLDGSGYAGDNVRVPVVLDNLIAAGAVPPMAAIFVDPGVMPAISEDAQNRYERIFEYDSLTPRFASFLIEELIPEVAKTHNLSKDPNDHGIAGLSTGGVGAFVAAWNRPDQFRRVITWIGSFGNFRGADRLPGLIRRTEPRPLRVFMQTGRQDLVNYAGSWYLENPRMAAALEFAGNDVRIELGEDGHSNRHGASMLPETLRWLWRGYPAPIVAGEAAPGAGRGIFAQTVPRREMVPPPPNPASAAAPARGAPPAGRGGGPRGAVYTLIYPDRLWEPVGDSYGSASSPAADRDGNVFFADRAANRIYRSDSTRGVTVFKENTGGAQAIRIGADGRLYATQPAAKRIVSYGTAPATAGNNDEKVVAQNVEAGDLALTKSGAIYFVDTANKTIGYINAGPGERGPRSEMVQRRVVYNGGGIMSPTALTLTPDQAMLLVGDGMDRYQWSFQIAADGSLVNGEPFQRLEMPEEGLFSGVGGLATDTLGYMWATSAMGIQVCEQPGRCTNILNKPAFNALPVTGIAFGGAGRTWLYVTQGGRLYRRDTKRTGSAVWEPISLPSQDYERMTIIAVVGAVGRVGIVAIALGLQSAPAQERTVADGVYTDTQATRGAAAYDAACSGCHRADLSGGTGPALKAQRFARIYAGKDLRTLYTKIATTMPRGTPASLADDVYLDIVAHVLRENGFKAGEHELTADALDDTRVLPGQPKPSPPVTDYSYVEVVGCLTPTERGGWLLTKASAPVVASATASAADASATPPGTQTFRLLDALAYPAAAHRGHRMYVRGLLIKLPDEQRLTISAFEMVSPTCGG